MKKFTRQELTGIGIILGIVFIASFFNFRISLRKARDAQRVSDLGQMVDLLAAYQKTAGSFPQAVDGKIRACKGPDTYWDPKIGSYINLLACSWGNDSLLGKLPIDSQSSQGAGYLYFSDGKTYQLYAALEGRDEAEYKPEIVARNLSCGARICNAGKAYGQTPLDKSIEEYENEIRSK